MCVYLCLCTGRKSICVFEFVRVCLDVYSVSVDACLGGLEVSGVLQVTGTHSTHSLLAGGQCISHRGAGTGIHGIEQLLKG